MRWLWIDRIVELVPGQRLVAIKNLSLAEEYFHDHFPASGEMPATPIMPACFILEGMAQTAGILVGHAEGFREKVALAKISKAELSADAVPGQTLRYTATLQNLDALGASTAGVVELFDPTRPGEATTIGQIDLMFSHLDHNMAGLDFPAHNFVFGESFKTVLRMSGVG
ncbi:MAG: hypothetical protein HBSAPP03_03430 [Phycisphaerae bacterium]|nr:MAG: hypothetical protein HBSAPP03_03430 [Phycisphaerae bacterium]